MLCGPHVTHSLSLVSLFSVSSAKFQFSHHFPLFEKLCNLLGFYLSKYILYTFNSLIFFRLLLLIKYYNLIFTNVDNTRLFSSNLESPENTNIKFYYHQKLFLSLFKFEMFNSHIIEFIILKYTIWHISVHL